MRIGLIGPMENEIMPLIEKIENKEVIKYAMLNFYKGDFQGVPVVAVKSGICKVNAAIATQVLIDKFDVSTIILTGVAGALDDRLHIGDIVIGDEIAYHDVAEDILTEHHPRMDDIYFKADRKMILKSINILEESHFKDRFYLGRIITGETFITHKERYELIKNFRPLCVDMESASVAHVCYANNIPFLVIRAMSDSADESGLENFEKNLKVAALNSLFLVEKLIKASGN